MDEWSLNAKEDTNHTGTKVTPQSHHLPGKNLLAMTIQLRHTIYFNLLTGV